MYYAVTMRTTLALDEAISLEEKYAWYRRELKSISANNDCAELMKIKAAYRIEHGDDLTPPPPESAIMKAKQVTTLPTATSGRVRERVREREGGAYPGRGYPQ